MEYLDFKAAKCKDCFKCLRECPVKAIRYENHQAKIIADKCILCGRCTVVCPQNAKKVHSELEEIMALLDGNEVVASVAPSFISSFDVQNFAVMDDALKKLGFSYTEETAIGAKAVTDEYARLLKTKKYKNLISSSCPAINRMLQVYYPEALKYLAPVLSPMLAHAKMLKKRFPNAKIVFIGPCIAKKREGAESGLVDGVLTFEELKQLFDGKGIAFDNSIQADDTAGINRAKYYPISSGIIKSFKPLPKDYEYVAVDGVRRSFEIFEDIEYYSGLFIEVNCCEYACVNGPCAIKKPGNSIKADENVRRYVNKDLIRQLFKPDISAECGDITERHQPIGIHNSVPCERDIRAVLAKTGKKKPEDELNCGACGYSTCREKAIAVLNGNAELDMCIPYMRTRAESMSYEIIQNSPEGMIVIDNDFKILEYNAKAKALLGIDDVDAKGKFAYECFDATEFVLAENGQKQTVSKRIPLEKTKRVADLTIVVLKEHKVMFGILKDVTEKVEYDKKLLSLTEETLSTTDEVIKKQMRVAQDIAALLGETTAETKVALLKLKKTLTPSKNKEGD